MDESPKFVRDRVRLSVSHHAHIVITSGADIVPPTVLPTTNERR